MARVTLCGLIIVGALGMVGCTEPDNRPTAHKVGVILPDTKTSQRWVDFDPVFLAQEFAAASVPADIQNAQGDPQRFVDIGDAMIADGVSVLVIASLDSASGRAVLEKARKNGVPTIDYDRLTLHGGADYYVSFDNEEIGRLQGRTLIKCLKGQRTSKPVVAALNGSPDDNNATLYKSGADSVLQAKFDDSSFLKGPDQSVPGWDPVEGELIFEQMLDQQSRIGAVLAANDGLANAVIKVLRKKGLAGKVPVTGQDATVEGLQNILTGEQCMTVYKAIKPEAQQAARLAIALYKGERPGAASKVKDPRTGRYVPSILLPSKVITISTVKDVVKDGFVARNKLCTKKFSVACERAGI